MATFSENGLMRVLQLPSQQLLGLHKFNAKLFPNDICFSPDSKYIAFGFAGQMVKILTVDGLRETHNYHHPAPVRHLEWHPSPDKLQLVSSDDSRKVYIFDFIANKTVGQVDGGHTFTLTNKGNQIITIHEQEIRVYAYKGLKLLQKCNVGVYLEAVIGLREGEVLAGGEETPVLAIRL